VLSLIGIVALALLLLFAANNGHTPRAIAVGATFVVNSNQDDPDTLPGNGTCSIFPTGECTLRAAIMEANANYGVDTILFGPEAAGEVVSLTDNLPAIVEKVIIDASYCAPGIGFCNSGGFSINANGYGGLVFDEYVGSSANTDGQGSTLRGIHIANVGDDYPCEEDTNGGDCYPDCEGVGVCLVWNSNHIIGGDAGMSTLGATTGNVAPWGQGNVIRNSYDDGIYDESFGGNIFQGNRIGTTPDGHEGLIAQPFGPPISTGNGDDGIEIDDTSGFVSADSIIGGFGGNGQGYRNIISNNDDEGIRIRDTSVFEDCCGGNGQRVDILNNYIGLNITGQSFGTGFGPPYDMANGSAAIMATNAAAMAIIGNRLAGGCNLPFTDCFGADGWAGIAIFGSDGGNVIDGNCIGFDAPCVNYGGFGAFGVILGGLDATTWFNLNGTPQGRNVIGNIGWGLDGIQVGAESPEADIDITQYTSTSKEDDPDTGIAAYDAEVKIVNNYIGFNISGTTAAPVSGDCVHIDHDWESLNSTVINNAVGNCQYDGISGESDYTMSTPDEEADVEGAPRLIIRNNKVGLGVDGITEADIGAECVQIDEISSVLIETNTIGYCMDEGIEAVYAEDIHITNNTVGLKGDGKTPAPIGIGRPPFDFTPCVGLYGLSYFYDFSGDFPNTVTGNTINNCNEIGIWMIDSAFNTVDNNKIGVATDGTTPPGNLGVRGPCMFIVDSSVIFGENINTISNNLMMNCLPGDPNYGDATILVNGSTGNDILSNTLVAPASADSIVVQGVIAVSNKIQGNKITMVTPDAGLDLPIDLRLDISANTYCPEGQNTNDTGDLDIGPNNCHNHPVLPAVSATLNCATGTAGGGDIVEVYGVSGLTYTSLGTTTAAAGGAWSLCGLSGGSIVTATATRGPTSTIDILNDTSEMFPGVQTVAGVTVIFGDNNQGGSIDTIDAIQDLLFVAGQTVTNPGSIPEVGDVVIINAVPNMVWGALGPCMSPAQPSVFDAIKTLNFIAGNPVSPFAGCPALGDQISLGTPNP
jgi:CSLREA domain-containing protein